MYIIFGNFGNNTIAAIQWAYNTQLKAVTVVHVETGWSASSWSKRVQKGQALAKKYHFHTQTLYPNNDFSNLVKDRKSFPNTKYQWCPTFLKALPLLTWLDAIDDRAQATIILGSRRADSRARLQLPTFIEESEYYGDRKVWYPLCLLSDLERDALIVQAGFKVLKHRSLECDPCIHSGYNDFIRLEQEKIRRIDLLERELNQTMFHAKFPHKTITQLVSLAEESDATCDASLENFDLGCGSHFACGE